MSEYKLKTDPLDEARRKKIIKKIIDDCKEDRKLAEEAYQYFKGKVDADETDQESKKCMVACLKLMQSAPANAVKLVTIVSRQVASAKPGEKTLGDELDLDDLLEKASNGAEER